MNDWKIRQEIYHKLNRDHTDDLNNHQILINNNKVDNAIKYFNEIDLGWIYPAKSYMVGICYSKWLAEYFGGKPLEYLNDPDLLYGNDPYFLPYNKDQDTYNSILLHINGWDFDETKGMVSDVKDYFLEEFLLKTDI